MFGNTKETWLIDENFLMTDVPISYIVCCTEGLYVPVVGLPANIAKHVRSASLYKSVYVTDEFFGNPLNNYQSQDFVESDRIFNHFTN